MTQNFNLTGKIQLWVVSTLVLMALAHAIITVESLEYSLLLDSVQTAVIPLAVVMFLVLLHQRFTIFSHPAYSYLLFFSISITSVLGLTQTLTGSHAESPSLLLYGLSFYTASLAYLIHRKSLRFESSFLIGNPLLLITGPIVIGYRVINYRGLSRRFGCFFPYIVFGVFLHQAIATPLTNIFELVEKTDLVSSLVFALIFEMFVYANFCGLSLIVYGVAGTLGLKIPLNFRQPFSATNLIDFWKGWHTSLSAVLKALFYNPFRKAFGTFTAVIVVYVASAMWHGVTLNFLVWGIFHAACFILTMKLLKSPLTFLTIPVMIVGVVVGRLLFADSDTDRLLDKLQFRFVDLGVFSYLAEQDKAVLLSLVLILTMVLAEFVFRKSKYFRQRRYKFYRLPWVQVILLGFTLALVSQSSGMDYAVYGQR